MYGGAALISLVVAAPFALAIAIGDLKRMEISNRLNVITGVAFLALIFWLLPFEEALWRVVGALVVFAACFAMFLFNMLGGGDAKTAPVFALLVAPQDAAFVLVLLSASALVGYGVIAALRRTSLAEGEWEVWRSGRRFPYGVALSSALLIYLALIVVLHV